MTIPTQRTGPTLRVEGPTIDLSARCGKCEHLRSEYYCIEDGNDVDSGFNRTCAHPEGKGAMGEATPAWCPLLPAAHLALGRALVGEGESVTVVPLPGSRAPTPVEIEAVTKALSTIARFERKEQPK